MSMGGGDCAEIASKIMTGTLVIGKAAGGFGCVAEAQKTMSGARDTIYSPDRKNQKVYAELYTLHRTPRDAFGTRERKGKLGHAMKGLIALRSRRRRS
ncbi:MAG: hypothetical protein QME60_08755 [Verrucomicrobiota bacterium]|nr:hypothetical protein [Verrucomicrobiota bacterium]